MRFAIMESIVGTGGHEVEWDRQIVEGLQALGHEVTFYLPQGYELKYDYRVPINYLTGTGVTYVGMAKIKKIWLSIKREMNRLRWYQSLYRRAVQGEFEALIFPTATFRFLRSLNHSILRRSPVPVIFCVLGVTPEEGPDFFREVNRLGDCPNVKIVVVSLLNDILGQKAPNVSCVKPPIFTANAVNVIPAPLPRQKLKIGFFGQYRQEKRMEDFIKAFLNCSFRQPVELVVQTVAIKPEDCAVLKAIKAKYQNNPGITFFDKAVYGQEWYEVIGGMDALVIPYATKRFRYHGSGMLLTAIGLAKPVVIADEIWPELLRDYRIGLTYKTGDSTALTTTLETFVATYNAQTATYQSELVRVNADFSPRQFVAHLVAVTNH